MLCSMTHKHKCSLLILNYRKYICNCFYHICIVFFCGKQRIAEFHRLEVISSCKNVCFHKIVLHSIHYVSWLNDHLFDSVLCHALHSFFHVIIMNVIPFFNLRQDHLACPGTINPVLGKSGSNCLFNCVNSHFSGILMAGSKAYHKNCFLGEITHSLTSIVLFLHCNYKVKINFFNSIFNSFSVLSFLFIYGKFYLGGVTFI